MSPAASWAVAAAVLAAAAYWLLITTEGTYLGPRVVALLYDWTARSYDRIKNVQLVYEAERIGIPLAERLGESPGQRVLDVACGTGRVALALRLSGGYLGTIIGLDRSSGMLREAAGQMRRTNVPLLLVRGDAEHLPFPEASMDAVTCLEAIEFFTRPAVALGEFRRVLKPGGTLLVSNRVGSDARLLPWRHTGRGHLEHLLHTLGYVEIDTRPWQVHYDMIWARKPADEGLGETSEGSVTL